MITEELYNDYLKFLLQGNRAACTHIVQGLLDQGIDLKSLYQDLFERSLYKIGELWESNQISVAKEHLATAITEGMMNLIYPRLFEKEGASQTRKAIISCAANEYHQVGGKMVADILEFQGWDAHFLGANTPEDHMLAYIQEMKPDLVGLSLSIYFNVPSLQSSVKAIRTNFHNLDILIGGQAFRWGGASLFKNHKGVQYVQSLEKLEDEMGGISS